MSDSEYEMSLEEMVKLNHQTSEALIDLLVKLDNAKPKGFSWGDILGIVIVAFVYGAWFGVIMCPK